MSKNKGECCTNFRFYIFVIGVKMRDDKKQNIFYIAMNLISITHILTHILHLQKHKQNKAKCCTNFRFSIYDLGVKMGDDKYTKTYFYISINFISITNVQTTSKT